MIYLYATLKHRENISDTNRSQAYPGGVPKQDLFVGVHL